MKVGLRETAFDPFAELAGYQNGRLRPGSFGAASVFIGSARDFNRQGPVSDLVLEHYPGMTDIYLNRIAAEAVSHWPLEDLLLLHRYGRVSMGDAIVLIAVWSGHRGAAFEACRYLIEELKHRAPFWKNEAVGGRRRWVTENTRG